MSIAEAHLAVSMISTMIRHVRSLPYVRDVLFDRGLRHTFSQFQLSPLDSYTPVEGLEDSIRVAMTSLSGVHLLCLPHNAGKTTATLRVADELYKRGLLRNEWPSYHL